MAGEKKNKSVAEQAYETHDAAAVGIENSSKELAGQMKAAGEQQMSDLDAAEKQRAGVASSAMERFRQMSDQGITDFAGIVESERNRIKQAEAEAKQQIQGDRRAAQLTGVTEALASIANLIGVAGHGASNQVYHQYSQDWMRKADQDMREHRARIDNLRDRQNALQERLIQMRQGDAETALNFAMREAETARNHATNMANLRYNTAVAPAQVEREAADKAAALRLQGDQARLQYEQRDKELGVQDRRQKQQLDAQMLMRGFVPDASAPGGYRFDEEQAEKIGLSGVGTRSTSRSGSGSGSGSGGNSYDVVVRGRRMTLGMSDGTFKQAILDGKQDIKNDLIRMAGAKDWKEMDEGTGRKGKYQQYAGIIDALNGTGDNKEDEEVINRFLQDHRDEMSEFNEHLFRVSNRQTDWGPFGMAQAAQEQMTPGGGVMAQAAQEQKSWDAMAKSVDDEFFGVDSSGASVAGNDVGKEETDSAPLEDKTERPIDVPKGQRKGDVLAKHEKNVTDGLLNDLVEKAIDSFIDDSGIKLTKAEKRAVKNKVSFGLKNGKSIQEIYDKTKDGYILAAFSNADILQKIDGIQRDMNSLSAIDLLDKYGDESDKSRFPWLYERKQDDNQYGV